MTDALIDTSFFIDLRRGRHAGAQRLWSRIEGGSLRAAYCPVTVVELWRGRTMDRAEELFYELIMRFMVEEPLDSVSAKQAGVWLRALAHDTSELLIRDALIAGVAARLEVPVYTTNRRHFERFPVRVLEY